MGARLVRTVGCVEALDYQDVEDRQIGHEFSRIGQHLIALAGHCGWGMSRQC